MAPALTDIGVGRTLVLLHGWAVDRSFFSAQAPLAERGFRIVAPDLPGHGEREAGPRPPTMAGLADDLAELIRRLDLADVVLVGWSMGATLALDYLARACAPPVAGLVIVDMSPRVANEPAWPHGLAGGQGFGEAYAAAGRMQKEWPAYAGRIARSMFADGVDEDSPLVSEAAARIATRDPDLMAAYWRSLVEADHRGTVARLDVPVLALCGDRSRLYRSDVAAWIAGAAQHGRALTIAGAGHAPHLERPDAFNAAVASFAARL